MKQLILCVIFLLGFYNIATAQIKIPDKIEANTPIIAEAPDKANLYLWTLVKTTVATRPVPAFDVPVDGGRILHIWAEPGKYTLKLNSITILWDKEELKTTTHTVEFEVYVGTPTPDVPIPPKPTGFSGKVSEALKLIDKSVLSHKDKVAGVYAGIAGEAEAGPNSWDAATMVNEAKVRNASALPTSALTGWIKFWPELAKAFVELKLDPSDLQGHIKAFRDVAEVLSK